LAEREATAGREAVYKHYSKAEASVKKELKATTRASKAEEAKAISAIVALQEEEYDANQVEEAYEAKHKPRADGE